jgi:hypothetical protein
MENINNFIDSHIVFVLTGLFLVFLALAAWNIVIQIKLKRQKSNILSEKRAIDLEKLLLGQDKSLKLLDKDIQELYSISNQINNLAFRGIHRVGMVRFNPFKDVGGDQSFSLALLNGKNSGFTISSLYTREGARIYCKAIVEGKAEKYPLAEEEKKAIQIAMKPESKKM